MFKSVILMLLAQGSTNTTFLQFDCCFVHLVKILDCYVLKLQCISSGLLFVRDEWILELEIHHKWSKQGQVRIFFLFYLVLHSSGVWLLGFFCSLNNLSDDPCQGFPVKSLWEHLINFGRKSLVLHLDILFCSLRFAVPSANSKSDISLTDAAFFNLS